MGVYLRFFITPPPQPPTQILGQTVTFSDEKIVTSFVHIDMPGSSIFSIYFQMLDEAELLWPWNCLFTECFKELFESRYSIL